MRGDSARGMRGECEGYATAKARGQGAGARGKKQRGQGKKPKAQKSISAKPHATTLDHLAKALMLCFLRLLAFFPAPSASPLPLPPASSGRWVGSVGRVGSGRWVGSGWRLSPCPCPLPLPQDKESRVSKTLLSFHN